MKLVNNKRLFILIIVIIIGIILFLFPIKKTQISTIGINNIIIGELKKDDIVKGFFKPVGDNMDSIGLKFSTYEKHNNHGKIRIVVKEFDKKIIADKVIDLKDIADNSKIYVGFKKQKNSNKKEYTVTLSFNEFYDDIKLATWAGDKSTENNYLIFNGEKTGYSLFVSYRSVYNVYDFVFYSFLIASAMLVYNGVGAVKYENNER